MLIMGPSTRVILRSTPLLNYAKKTKLNRDLPSLKLQGQTVRQRE